MKPTLLDIRRKTSVTTKDIAERARLSVGDVFTVEAGGYTSVEKAQLVVSAFNHLSGMQVRLDDIHMGDSTPVAPRRYSPFNREAYHG